MREGEFANGMAPKAALIMVGINDIRRRVRSSDETKGMVRDAHYCPVFLSSFSGLHFAGRIDPSPHFWLLGRIFLKSRKRQIA